MDREQDALYNTLIAFSPVAVRVWWSFYTALDNCPRPMLQSSEIAALRTISGAAWRAGRSCAAWLSTAGDWVFSRAPVSGEGGNTWHRRGRARPVSPCGHTMRHAKLWPTTCSWKSPVAAAGCRTLRWSEGRKVFAGRY